VECGSETPANGWGLKRGPQFRQIAQGKLLPASWQSTIVMESWPKMDGTT
jgi:hypothetical protein